MADEKPLTKADLAAALKGFRQEANRDLASLRQQVRDDAFEDRTEFYSRLIKPEIDGLREETRTEIANLRAEMKTGFKDVDTRLGRVETELHWVKDEVKGLKEEFSTTPRRGEFNRLKARVDKYHPAN